MPAPCGSSPRRSATGPRRTASRPRAAPTQIDNVAYMKELHAAARDAVARGEAPPTAASMLYNLDHALGDVDTAIAYVQRLADAGVDNVMCLIQMGTLTQAQQLETIRLWGEKVIPHFRALAV